jgi:hypothetical protein
MDGRRNAWACLSGNVTSGDYGQKYGVYSEGFLLFSIPKPGTPLFVWRWREIYHGFGLGWM